MNKFYHQLITGIFFAGTLFAEEALAGHFVDFRNRPIETIDIRLGVMFTNEKTVASSPQKIRYVGDEQAGFIRGEVGGCRVGETPIPNSSIRLLLGGVEVVEISQAKNFFDLVLVYSSNANVLGALSCDSIEISVASK